MTKNKGKGGKNCKKGKPGKAVPEVLPQKYRYNNGKYYKDATHGRSSLFDKVCLRTVGPNLLPQLLILKPAYDTWAHDKGNDKCCYSSIGCSEGDVLKYVYLGS